MKYIDLFCGAGGFRLAMRNLGFDDCVLSSDIEPNAIKVYKDNFGEKPVGDIRGINNIPDFDILLAGFPCQPFSIAGAKKGFGDETKGTLFFEVLRVLSLKRPEYFLLENVPAIISNDQGNTLRTIITSLESLGYNIKYGVVNSYDFGVPQNRKRWYCVGALSKIDISVPTSADVKKLVMRDIIDSSIEDTGATLSTTLRKAYYLYMSGDTTTNPFSQKLFFGKRAYRAVQKKSGDVNLELYNEHRGIWCRHQGYKFYSLDNPSPTLLTRFRPAILELGRALNHIELRRVQGFPDSFLLNVSPNNVTKLMGNSVSVPVIQQILSNLLGL